ncbi:MSMEG_0567/Sll0786 family nitrogen starvation N-acetyltransferase, partial [Nocardioides sp.]|uniref:MSMEG_0567/Sll0786 family nitrogen starvation N-acetyltransferase n=1 Tax=Nocardioides sp. TaxID=35761 RepID=UPI0031FE7A6E|nr:synthase [Nocardioides sp.]
MTEVLEGPQHSLDRGILTGTPPPRPHQDPQVDSAVFVVGRADSEADLAAYHRLRHDAFVQEQGMFSGHDRDDADDDPRTIVLVSRGHDGAVIGGVRLHPSHHAAVAGHDIGWWRGGRLVVAPKARTHLGVGAALVRAACAAAEDAGALRFEATVQARNEVLFRRLGWTPRERVELHGHPHVVVDWPIGRIQRLADATKSVLGSLLGELQRVPFGGGGPGFVGDDGAPVPGTDVIAACDAILPSMVERDPEWAGWCAALVNLNDLSAMGAAPIGLLDA